MFCNLLQHADGIIQHARVGKSKDANSLSEHVCGAIAIVMPLFVPVMNRAIAFNYQRSLSTIEIDDIVTELVLSPEFKSVKLAITQKLPKHVFGQGLICA